MKIISRKEAKERGLARYFTGKPCKNGHTAERITRGSVCIDCKQIWDKNNRQKNAERIRITLAKWYAKNKESEKKKRATHYIENKDSIKLRVKQYADNNKDKIAASSKSYYQRNKDAIKNKTREYAKNNKEKLQAYAKKYQQDNHTAIIERVKRHKLSKRQRTPAWLAEDDLWMMREIYELAALRTKLTCVKHEVDHIVPLHGSTVSGLHVPTNLRVIPAVENRQKSNQWDPDNVK